MRELPHHRSPGKLARVLMMRSAWSELGCVRMLASAEATSNRQGQGYSSICICCPAYLRALIARNASLACPAAHCPFCASSCRQYGWRINYLNPPYRTYEPDAQQPGPASSKSSVLPGTTFIVLGKLAPGHYAIPAADGTVILTELDVIPVEVGAEDLNDVTAKGRIASQVAPHCISQ